MALPKSPKSGIYIIRHIASNKVYVGSAVHIPQRWRQHRHDLKLLRHHSVTLQRAWNKYGSEVFSWEIVELVLDPKSLITREQIWIDCLNACNPSKGYNSLPIAGSSLGRKASPETLEKQRKAAQGVKHGPCTEERRKNISAGRMGFGKGVRLPPERAAAQAAHLRSEETITKWRAAMKARVGKPLNPGHAANVRAALVARNKAMAGQPHTPDRKAKSRSSYYSRIGQPSLPL